MFCNQYLYTLARKTKKKRKTLTNLPISDTSAEGFGIGKREGKVFMVEGAVPGDVVTTEIYRKKKKIPIGKLQRLEVASHHRRTPPCPHFDNCGGCKWQQLTYPAQLAQKQKMVADALTRIGGLELPNVRPTLGCQQEFFYRNKVEFSFSANRWLTEEEIQDTARDYDFRTLGFHVPRFFDKVLEIRHCSLHPNRLNPVRNYILDAARQQQVPFYNLVNHTGFLRHLVFRSGFRTAETMLTLIVAEDDEPTLRRLLEPAMAAFPWITTWTWIVNNKKNDSYNDLPARSLAGQGYITEVLGGYRFRISPTSFFQTNPLQAERLYRQVKDWIPQGSPRLLDLYSGTGSIGIFCEERVEKILGVEYVEPAVQDAYANARLNQLSNKCNYLAGDLKKLIRSTAVADFGPPDVVVTDPPRAGMDEKVTRELLALAPPRIIYVSCKPATQARDLALLAEGYTVAAVQPVDMFPQTAHVENVVLLERR